MKIRVHVLALVYLMLQSGNLLATGSSVTPSVLQGQWISNCRFVQHSDPTNPERGTYQKVFLEFTEQMLSVNVAIHQAEDTACSKKTLFDAKSKYNYSLEGDITLQDNKLVTKLTGSLTEDSQLFDGRMKDILYFKDSKLYMGLDLDEEAIRYPEVIDSQLFFTKMR